MERDVGPVEDLWIKRDGQDFWVVNSEAEPVLERPDF